MFKKKKIEMKESVWNTYIYSKAPQVSLIYTSSN